MKQRENKKMKLNEILIDKHAGSYTYKLNNTYYNLYKYNSYWVVYETEDVDISGDVITPYDWMVLNSCATLKEAKEAVDAREYGLKNGWDV